MKYILIYVAIFVSLLTLYTLLIVNNISTFDTFLELCISFTFLKMVQLAIQFTMKVLQYDNKRYVINIEKESEFLNEKVDILVNLSKKVNNKYEKVHFYDLNQKNIFLELFVKGSLHRSQFKEIYTELFMNDINFLQTRELREMHKEIDKACFYFNKMVIILSEIKKNRIESQYNSIIQEDFSYENYNNYSG